MVGSDGSPSTGTTASVGPILSASSNDVSPPYRAGQVVNHPIGTMRRAAPWRSNERRWTRKGALMDPSRPLVLAGARYASSHQAVRDYRIVWGARHGGAFDHMSIAVLTRNACGELQVERHDSAARDLALGGAVLRAALLVVAPTVGTAMVAAGGGGLAGAGGIAAHLLHTISEEKLQEVRQLLGSGESGLLIVAIDRRGIEISPLLEQAEKAAVIETKTGDLDAAFYGAFEAGTTTTGHAAPCRHARATGPIAGDAPLADWPAG